MTRVFPSLQHVAAASGQDKVVLYLLQKKADPNAKGESAGLPLEHFHWRNSILVLLKWSRVQLKNELRSSFSKVRDKAVQSSACRKASAALAPLAGVHYAPSVGKLECVIHVCLLALNVSNRELESFNSEIYQKSRPSNLQTAGQQLSIRNLPDARFDPLSLTRCADLHGKTPLSEAVHNGHLSTAEVLRE